MKRYLLLFAILLITTVLLAQAPTISSLSVAGSTIKWYNASSGGTQYTDPANTALVHGQTYYASQTVNGVESITRIAITATLITQAAPSTGTHTPSQTQVVWNWNAASGATGYKWSTANLYSGATDLGNVLTKTETSLTCNTAYIRYIWAYNGSGCISAATTLSQTTSSCIAAPALATSAASSIGATTVTLNGNITAINGANATIRGFKYSTTNNFDPTSSGTTISESGTFGTGTFSLSPSNLASSTAYYVVAYATNSAGTTYGSQVSFTTTVYIVWTFISASATGKTGPTQAQLNSAYSGTSLAGGVTINTQGIQEWTVPTTGTYRMDAFGAKGGNTYQVFRTGGNGANMKGDFSLTAGDVLKIVVGQTAANYAGTDQFQGGGGGGGSFVWKSAGNTLLIAAGGGGGAGSNQGTPYNGASGVTSTSGSASNGQFVSPGGTSGNGGGENTGDGGHGHGGSAGGGWLSDGASTLSFAEGGFSILYGGAVGGRNGSILSNNYGSDGGFGGGGGAVVAGGGGGGYSGGGAGNQPNSGGWYENGGGGGGSYNSGSNPSNTAGSNSGNGQVIITKL